MKRRGWGGGGEGREEGVGGGGGGGEWGMNDKKVIQQKRKVRSGTLYSWSFHRIRQHPIKVHTPQQPSAF